MVGRALAVADPGATRDLVAALRAAGDPGRAVQEKRYLKSELTHFGASVPAIRRVVTDFARRHPGLTRPDVLALVEGLWVVPVHERRMAAVELLDLYGSLLEPADLRLVERLIRESRTWALVDGLAATVAGGLVERFPELADALDRWAADDDFWVRRSALLTLLVPLRRGEGDFDRFARYADEMLEEREFFIRKAIGWVLREAAKERPGLVARWLRPRAARASGVTVREAVKHLPHEEREGILAARK
jgi:3-methyladenine DNA glycosylase AlkD